MRQSSTSSTMYPPASTREETTRHWNFTAFEWVVRDVSKLKKFVEDEADQDDTADSAAVHEDFEILRDSPLLGDGKFKLEIGEYQSAGTSKDPMRTLTLYITSLMMDYAHDFEMSASMMAAIKCQDDRVGERGARGEWVWEFWQHDFVFRQESEVWECALPSVSVLLENPRIMETNSFVICVQIHSPTGPFVPQQSSAYYVPRDLLEGLEASLDNPNTGDVRFICLERLDPASHDSSTSPATSHSRRSSSASSSHSPFHSHLTARKRVIYAHLDILTRRSDYFATMLASSFAENGPGSSPSGERKVYNIIVEEADFVTIYWLLKWVYANWLLFKESDDPRVAVDGVGAGWSARWLNVRGGEWDWKTFNKQAAVEDGAPKDDARSATSAESSRSAGERRAPAVGKGKQTLQPPTSPNVATGSRSPSTSKTTLPSVTTPRTPSNSRRNETGPTLGGSSTAPHGEPPSPARTKTVPVPVPIPQPHYQLAPLSQRHQSTLSSPSDPHPHPTPPPPPASALSMYQVAHRYELPGLASLALEHMMSTITPSSSFALLLATSVWDELHAFIEDYVVEKWDEVSVSSEFEQCCEEVAAGEWGSEGGKTLMGLFRRLRSPNTLSFPRT
ncbi:hypothetical protein JAAARDRAFT_117915 [Jaapia argillacea MUCL 33604]|uniref:BTB domain-containing protein n=1 Tax=Jaapia argillacea MUCL 33604 TaxID=933084 RepID=A0A067QLK3_9AGAM|nr:hypothetical protein JAAARDRAFT_117915 [Jaapia argillacea MUCL 33604]